MAGPFLHFFENRPESNSIIMYVHCTAVPPFALPVTTNLFNDEKFEVFCKGCANPGGIDAGRGYISYANFGGSDITSKSMHRL